MDKKKITKVLEMIAKDMAEDATNYDGKPFTGHTVGAYFGNQGAAIASLANIVKLLVENQGEPLADLPLIIQEVVS